MAMNEIRISLWCRRKWWVTSFLIIMLPVAVVAKKCFGDDGANRVVDFVGRFIGRYGLKAWVE